jgi:RNA polymerase sigma-70 factor, ECF subfamily
MESVSKWELLEVEDAAPDGSAVFVDLARRIRNGDPAAEARLIEHFQPGLRALLRKRTGGDFALMEDLVQETLLVVLQRLRGAGLEQPERLPGFTAQTARNLAYAVLRKTDRRRTDVNSEIVGLRGPTTPGVDHKAADEEAEWAVRTMLRELPHWRDRMILKRFYLDDQDRDSIRRELQLTEPAFNQALCRARLRFKAIIERRGFTKPDLLDPISS